MIKKLDHIGIAVKDLNNSIKLYKDILKLNIENEEEVKSEGIKVTFIPVGEIKIELLYPTEPNSTISKFLEKRGQGVHHLSYEVENIEECIKELKEKGIRLINEVPKIGAEGAKIVFLHPSSTEGVLIELKEVIK